MTWVVLGIVPWVITGAYFLSRTRMPPPLPPAAASPPDRLSVIVPARNEEASLTECLTSLTRSTHPDLEIVVVDDRSEDRTPDIVADVASRDPRVRLVPGQPLPTGWFGKPWACWQGARDAHGDLLLFTDADTVHHPELATRAVAALDASGAEALTLIARQRMETFWERAVQPQIFVLLMLRFRDIATAYDPALRDPARWPHAIANGQFILMRRDAYERLDGHRAVKGEVAEDLRLAQEIVRAGMGLALRDAADLFATRMYRSLGGVVEGWSKNVATASRQSWGPVWGTAMVPLAALLLLVLWVLPPVALVGSLAGLGGPELRVWAAVTTACGAAIWMGSARVFRIPAWSGLAFPAGAAMAAFILLRSAARGRRIRWKGRDYRAGA